MWYNIRVCELNLNYFQREETVEQAKQGRGASLRSTPSWMREDVFPALLLLSFWRAQRELSEAVENPAVLETHEAPQEGAKEG